MGRGGWGEGGEFGGRGGRVGEKRGEGGYDFPHVVLHFPFLAAIYFQIFFYFSALLSPLPCSGKYRKSLLCPCREILGWLRGELSIWDG